MIGLSRSLIAAGVPSVIVSLWSVNDRSTGILMIEFYQNLQQGMTATVALNKAQLWLLEVTKLKMEDWVTANWDIVGPTLRKSLRQYLNQLSEEVQPFRNPHYWAAFCAIGQ